MTAVVVDMRESQPIGSRRHSVSIGTSAKRLTAGRPWYRSGRRMRPECPRVHDGRQQSRAAPFPGDERTDRSPEIRPVNRRLRASGAAPPRYR